MFDSAKLRKSRTRIDLAPGDQITPVAVKKAVGMHDLISALAGTAIQIIQPDLAPGNDRLAQRAEDRNSMRR
jgi:hypothetical protein